MKKILSFEQLFTENGTNDRNYSEIKSIIKQDYDIDVDEKTLEEYELNIVMPDKHINKDYQQGEYTISNSDFARKYMDQELKTENTGAVSVGNISGMGAVVSAQPSGAPGQTTHGSGFSTASAGQGFGDGGKVGSGDVGVSLYGSPSKKQKDKAAKKPLTKGKGKSKNLAKFANQFKGDEYKMGGDKNAIQTFANYTKNNSGGEAKVKSAKKKK